MYTKLKIINVIYRYVIPMYKFRNFNLFYLEFNFCIIDINIHTYILLNPNQWTKI